MADTKFNPDGLLRATAPRLAGVERLAGTNLADTVEKMSRAVASAEGLGLLITGQPQAAVCLANRCAGVRAVAATDRGAVAAAIAAVGVNFLVVDPAGRSSFELQQIVSEFVRGGPRTCPTALAARLK